MCITGLKAGRMRKLPGTWACRAAWSKNTWRGLCCTSTNDCTPMPRIDPQACKPPASAGVKEQAAWWFARLHSGHASDAERRAFEAWRDADSEHDRQYRNTAYFWDAALDVPPERLRAVVDARVAPRPARRRYLAWATGAACAVALLAAVLGPQWRAPE